MKFALFTVFAIVLIGAALCSPARAQGDGDLVRELTNPVADLLTIPVQVNYDQNIGPVEEGWKLQSNVQPVIPFDLGENWNLITRCRPTGDGARLRPGWVALPGAGELRSTKTVRVWCLS